MNERAAAGMSLLIEFTGPSCAGKSTLVRKTAQELSERGWQARIKSIRRGRRRLDILRSLTDPRIALWCLLNLRWALRNPDVRNFLGIIGVVRRLRRRGGIFLIDEGPLKRCPDPNLRMRGVSLLLAGIPRPDVLVIVSCDPETRIERLRREDREHVRGLTDRQILARPSQDVLGRLYAIRRRAPAVEVDTSPEAPDPDLPVRLAPWLPSVAAQ